MGGGTMAVDRTLGSRAIGTSLGSLSAPGGDTLRPSVPPPPPADPPFGLTFSGGGFRATLAALGIVRFLADVGLLWVYWADPDETAVMPQASPTALEGFPRKRDLIDRYAAASGRDLSDLPFYVAFGYWKLTCIIAGVYARYAAGAMGDVPAETVKGFRGMPDLLGELTHTAAGEVS